MRVVVAPDSFKGSASAVVVARAIADGWRDVRPGDDVVELPMADGGEGTLDALAATAGAERRAVTVTGPDGRDVAADWVLLPDGTAVVELASTSGLTLLDRLDPLGAHTLGFGQAIAAALDAGVHRLLLALGGSASTDGGAGMLAALGLRALDRSGRPVEPGGGGLRDVAAVDRSGLRALPVGGAVVLADVVNPLLGPTGAVAVFAEQKGADAEQRELLESGLAHWAGLFETDPAAAGAGAAGGTGYGALVWGASITSGAAAVAEAVGLPDRVRGADLVITGEGRFDAQTAAGKAPAVVAAVAAAAGVPVALVAGAITAEPSGFEGSVALVDLAGGAAPAIAESARWLRTAGASLASTFHP